MNDKSAISSTEKRMLDLLDHWLTSLELHLKYTELDDTAYAQIQPWPKHDRPMRWILELAQQRTLALKAQLTERAAARDTTFAEALELMYFLANLVGAQHIQRFIPIAEVDKERPLESEPELAPKISTPPSAHIQAAEEDTRRMPQLNLARASKKTAKPPKQSPSVASKKISTPTTAVNSTQIQEIIIADAVRLLKWGREWHQLAESIARMAERPPIAEVRQILRTHRTKIEALTK